LPERIAAQHGFPLAHKDHEDGRRYYAVQDWIAGVAQPASHPGQFWNEMKKRLKKAGIELSTWCLKFSYRASNGKEYQMDHADAETLYRITQRMDANTGLRNKILAYLAAAGVAIDEMARDPYTAQEMAIISQHQAEYRKLRGEGFTHEEALQWLRTRDYGIGTRKWITDIWVRRNARGKEIAILTNKVSQIVHGKTATKRKQEMGLSKHDTPRNYDAAADQLLTATTELWAGTAHVWRDSRGLEQLSEDVEDTRPLIDAARPHAHALLSKKPRRLPGENKPAISD
jgi:hypothetical protein